MHTSLIYMHKELSIDNWKRRMQAQQVHNDIMRLLSVNSIGEAFVVIRAQTIREHSIQVRWWGSMSVMSWRSHPGIEKKE